MREISLEHRDIRILRANFRVSLKRFNKVKPYGCTPAYQRPALFPPPPLFFSLFSCSAVQLQRINQMAVTKFTGERIGTE